MFDIENKLETDLNFFKVHMNAKQKLTYYINKLSEKDDFKFKITFYDYANEKSTAENTDSNITTLITAKTPHLYYTYKKCCWIKYYTKLDKNLPVYAEIKHLNDSSVDIRVFGKIALNDLKNIIKKWAIEEEIHVNYNVETVINNYKISEYSYKWIWQNKYKEL